VMTRKLSALTLLPVMGSTKGASKALRVPSQRLETMFTQPRGALAGAAGFDPNFDAAYFEEKRPHASPRNARRMRRGSVDPHQLKYFQ